MSSAPLTLFELIDHLPNPVPSNAIPFYDGCRWTLISMPANGINTCQDVQSCIDCNFISSLLNSSNGSINILGCNLTINPTVMNSLISATFTSPNLTVWTTVVNLSNLLNAVYFDIYDGVNTITINHTNTLNLMALDGLRFFVSWVNQVNIGLPSNAQPNQVLTWNQDTGEAEWRNNQCCAQTFNVDGQNLCLSGTNCVDMDQFDNQQLSLVGNILSLENSISVDLGNVNNHSLVLNGMDLELRNSQWTLLSTVTLPTPAIATCADVQNCMAAIVANIQTQINSLDARVTILETLV